MSKVVYEGWMVRYGQRKIGRSYIHMRYFVLESRLIAYYKRKPLDNVVPIKTLLIDGNCRVEDRGLKTQHGHPSFPTPFQQAQTSQTGGANGIDGVTEVGGQSTSAQQFSYQTTDAIKQSPVAIPFGPLPTVPQMLTDGPRTTPVVSEKPSPVRSSSLLTIRHLCHRKNRLPTPKYIPKIDGPKVPFFSDAHMTPNTAKAEALLPRENPRSLVIGPTEEWNLMANFENSSVAKHTSIHVYENGNVSVKVSAPGVDGSLYQNKDDELHVYLCFKFPWNFPSYIPRV